MRGAVTAVVAARFLGIVAAVAVTLEGGIVVGIRIDPVAVGEDTNGQAKTTDQQQQGHHTL